MDSGKRSSGELGIAAQTSVAGFSLKEFRQPPYQRLPWHEHEEASICFVVDGSYKERVGSYDRECVAHDMVAKPAGERHADQFGHRGGTCLLIEIHPERLAAISPFIDITEKPTLVRNPTLAALGHHIHSEFGSQDAYSPLVIEGLILEVLAETSRVGAEPGTRRPAWLQQAYDLIHDTFQEPLTLSSVAGAVGVHPSRLARVFRRHYRRSIGEYVRHLRVERAARELTEGRAPLAEIGLHAGFFDQSHFSRVFKAHTGQTPAQFRTSACARRRFPILSPYISTPSRAAAAAHTTPGFMSDGSVAESR
jgi:AraC family transcriptional regulator